LFEALFKSGCFFVEEPTGEGSGGCEEDGVVEQGECLQWGVGALAAGADLAGVGAVEGDVLGEGRLPSGEGVEAAAVAVWAGAGRPIDVKTFGDDAFGLGWEYAWSADGGGEESTDGEGGVADLFGGEAETGLAGEQDVLGVVDVGSGVGGLAIGGGGDDHSMQAFVAPAVLFECGGEPVEEFGMGGWSAELAEVFGGFDQAAAEEFLPGAIDGESGGEGVFVGD